MQMHFPDRAAYSLLHKCAYEAQLLTTKKPLTNNGSRSVLLGRLRDCC